MVLPQRPNQLPNFIATMVVAMLGHATLAAQTPIASKLTLGVAEFGLPNQTDILKRQSGKVTIPGRVRLVSKGSHTGIGTFSKTHFLGNRFSLSIGKTSSLDSDITGFVANPFATSRSRRAINFDGAIWGNEDTTLALSSTFLESTKMVRDDSRKALLHELG